ncbi:hypothetical protein [Acaryochloris marina]|uniref:hypothetical protein n=1 Tax=Acaryochloris marina TaxID=155978 RepID=UPI0020177219|nr:hypothetical protein [Acaryochloris marina]
MLITKHTNQVLKVDLQNWHDRFWDMFQIRAIPIVGVLIIIYGIIFSPRVNLSCNHVTVDASIYHQTQVVCNPTEVNLSCNHVTVDASIHQQTQVVCNLTESNMLDEKITKIEHLQKAREGYCPEDDVRVVLIAKRKKIPLPKKIPLTKSCYRKSVVSQQIAEIKEFINNPGEATLNIYEDHRWGYFLVGLATTIFGIFIIFCKSLTSCAFDKSSGRLYLEYQNSLSQLTVREESLDNIHKINFKESTGDEGKDYYHTEIVFKSDEIISFRSVKDDSEIVQAINQFLGMDDSVDS